jgi:hypothetical protein
MEEGDKSVCRRDWVENFTMGQCEIEMLNLDGSNPVEIVPVPSNGVG